MFTVIDHENGHEHDAFTQGKWINRPLYKETTMGEAIIFWRYNGEDPREALEIRLFWTENL